MRQKFSMSDPIDGEIISIINKLNKVQKVVGGAKGSALNKIEGKL